MIDALNAYSQAFSKIYYIRQVLAIIAFFVLGMIIMMSLSDKNEKIIRISLLAFPMILSLFAIEGYILLLVGIPYNRITTMLFLLIAIAIIVYFGNKKGMMISEVSGLWKALLICIGVVAVVALISCAGIAPTSISNDSMYRLHMYPKYIVYFGQIRDQFDTFLTDTSLGVAVIETIPFLFGFDESFGIREFLYIDLAAYFTYMTYCRLTEINIYKEIINDGASKLFAKEKKADVKRIALSVIAGLTFVLSSPAFIVGHWAMSNMLFMVFFFFAAVEAAELAEISTGNLSIGENGINQNILSMIPASVLMVSSGVMRAEGGIFIILLIICCMLLDINSKRLSLMVMLPLLILNGSYALKIYVTYTIDNPYTFLTPGKSAIQAAAMVCVMIYGIFLRDKLPNVIKRFMPGIYIMGLLLINAVLFAYNRSLFIADLKAFILNLTKQSGWGMVTELSIASAFVIAVYFLIMKMKGTKIAQDLRDVYFLVLTIGFFLVTFIVSFMRGDELSVEVGDSGNRVLLQVIPLVIYTLMLYFVRVYECDREQQ